MCQYYLAPLMLLMLIGAGSLFGGIAAYATQRMFVGHLLAMLFFASVLSVMFIFTFAPRYSIEIE